jgi:hypothetical protein
VVNEILLLFTAFAVGYGVAKGRPNPDYLYRGVHLQGDYVVHHVEATHPTYTSTSKYSLSLEEYLVFDYMKDGLFVPGYGFSRDDTLIDYCDRVDQFCDVVWLANENRLVRQATSGEIQNIEDFLKSRRSPYLSQNLALLKTRLR